MTDITSTEAYLAALGFLLQAYCNKFKEDKIQVPVPLIYLLLSNFLRVAQNRENSIEQRKLTMCHYIEKYK